MIYFIYKAFWITKLSTKSKIRIFHKGGNEMAKKGQVFRKYSDDLKNKVLKEHLELGLGSWELSRKYKVPRGTVNSWFTKYEKYGNLDKRERIGRPKEENIDYKERYEILKKFQTFLEEVDQEKK